MEGKKGQIVKKTSNMCSFCFNEGVMGQCSCVKCDCQLKLNHDVQRKHKLKIIKSIKCIKMHDDRCVKAEDEPKHVAPLTLCERPFSFTLKAIVFHCTKETQEFHFDLAKQLVKTECASLMNVILSEFHH